MINSPEQTQGPERQAAAKPETRYTRDEVILAFTASVQLLKEDKNLSAKEKAAKRALISFEDQTLNRGKPPVVDQNFEFKSPTLTKPFHDKEGPRSDVLKAFLDRKIAYAIANGHNADLKNLRKWRKTIAENSKHFYDYKRKPKRESDYQQKVGRIQYEASLIATDERDLGSNKKNYDLAVEELSGAEELIFPPKEPKSKTIAPKNEGKPPPPPKKDENEGKEEQPPPPPKKDENEGKEEQPPPPTKPESLEQVMTIGRTDELFRKAALEEAEKQLREEMRRGTILNPLNWARKISLRVGEEYFRQKLAKRAEKIMRENNNTFGEYNLFKKTALGLFSKAEAVNADTNRPDFEKAQKATIESADTLVRSGETFAGQKAKEVTGPLKQKIEDELLKKVISGTITKDQLQTELTNFVKTNLTDADIQEYFGVKGSDFGKVADYFASDVFEVGQAMKKSIDEGKYSLDQIDQFVKIRIANIREGAETKYAARKADKVLRFLSSHMATAALANPAVVGAAFSVVGFFGSRVAGTGISGARVAVPVVGALGGAAFAAWRRNYELKIDFAAHSRETAYGETAEPGAKRREALDKIVEKLGRAKASDLINGGGQDAGTPRLSVADILKRIPEGQDIDAALRRYTEIKTRLDFSAEQHVDLITFSNKAGVKAERMELMKAAVSIKEALKAKGVTDFDRFLGEYKSKFTTNKNQQDRAFAVYRLGETGKAALIGGLGGLGAGLLVSEGIALGENIAQHGLEGGLAAGGIHLPGGIPGTEFHPGGGENPFKGLYDHGGSTNIGDHFRAVANPDHSLTILDTQTNQPLPDSTHFAVGADGHIKVTGDIPQNLRSELEQKGFKITVGQDIVEGGKTVPVEKHVFGPEGEWTTHATNIDHREWYAYDQPGSQGNELRGYNNYGPTSATFDMSHMELGYQHGLNPDPIDVQDVIKNGQAGIYVSTGDHQSGGLWIPDSADGKIDGKVTLTLGDTHTFDTPGGQMTNDEAYKMIVNQNAVGNGGTATELNNRPDIWALNHGGQGGFVEYGRMTHDINGKNVLQTFATIHGTGQAHETITTITNEGIKSTIHTFDITPPEVPPVGPGPDGFRLPGVDDLPIIVPIPFAPRRPLEPTRQGEQQVQGQEQPARKPEALEEDKTLGDMFSKLQNPVIKGHKYFVEDPPGKIELTKEEMTSLESKLPFFEQEGDLVKAREEVVPFVWDPVVGIEKNPRFKEAEDLTQGDSGLLALAANSAPSPAEQARLYRTLTQSIIQVHENNPDLLKEWYKAQDEFSSSVFRGIDNQEIRKGDSRRLLLATELNATPEQQLAYIGTVWPERIKTLKTAIANRRLEPHHLRWIEFLSHSVNIPELVKKIQTQQPKQPVASAAVSGTANAFPAAPAQPVAPVQASVPAARPVRQPVAPAQTPAAVPVSPAVGKVNAEISTAPAPTEEGWGGSSLAQLARLSSVDKKRLQELVNKRARLARKPALNPKDAEKRVRATLRALGLKRDDYKITEKGEIVIEKVENLRKEIERQLKRAQRHAEELKKQKPIVPPPAPASPDRMESVARTGEWPAIKAEALTEEGFINNIIPRTPENLASMERSGKGWKIHLNVVPDVKDPITAKLKAFLDSEKAKYKIGHGGPGKGSTIYIGSRDGLEEFARRLEETIPELPEADGDVLSDDLSVNGSKKVWARFEVYNEPIALAVDNTKNGVDVNGRYYGNVYGDTPLSTSPIRMHQYGSKGVSFLNDDMSRVREGKMTGEEARRFANEVLKRRFGEFYTGSKNQFDPYPASRPEKDEVPAGTFKVEPVVDVPPVSPIPAATGNAPHAEAVVEPTFQERRMFGKAAGEMVRLRGMSDEQIREEAKKQGDIDLSKPIAEIRFLLEQKVAPVTNVETPAAEKKLEVEKPKRKSLKERFNDLGERLSKTFAKKPKQELAKPLTNLEIRKILEEASSASLIKRLQSPIPTRLDFLDFDIKDEVREALKEAKRKGIIKIEKREFSLGSKLKDAVERVRKLKKNKTSEAQNSKAEVPPFKPSYNILTGMGFTQDEMNGLNRDVKRFLDKQGSETVLIELMSELPKIPTIKGPLSPSEKKLKKLGFKPEAIAKMIKEKEKLNDVVVNVAIQKLMYANKDMTEEQARNAILNLKG